MAEDKTQIVVEEELRTKGFDKTIKQVEKLNEALFDVFDYLEEIEKKLKKLNNQSNPFTKLMPKPAPAPTPTSIRLAKNGGILGYTQDPRYDTDPQVTNTLSVQRAYMREQQELVKAKKDRVKQIIKNQDKEYKLDEEALAIKAERNRILDKQRKNAKRNAETAERRQALKERNEDLDRSYKETIIRQKQMKMDNPEIPLSQRANYIYGSKVKSAGTKLSNYGIPGRLVGGGLEVLGSAIINPAMGFAMAMKQAIVGVTDFAKAAVQASSEIEALKTNLGVVYGDPSAANAAFDQIAQYAVKSPFGVEQTTEMAVLLKQSGVYATDLMDTLRMIGDTAGGNADKMKRIANNYAQITSIGKASMLDMRQFAYAGIPIYKAVSKELGVTQEQLRRMISDGKVTSDIIEKVFKDLTGVNGLFENATAKGAKTLKARLQNLKDAQQLFMASMGDSFLGKGIQEKYNGSGFIVNIIDALENFFTKEQISTNLHNINKNVEAIEKYNSRIKFLQEGLKAAEESGDKDRIRLFKEALEHEAARRSISDEKAAHLASFNAKQGLLEGIPEEYKQLNLDDLYKLKKKYQFSESNGHISMSREMAEAFGVTGAHSPLFDKDIVTLSSLDMLVNKDVLGKVEPYLKDMSDKVKQAISALEAIEEFSEEEIQAHRENLIKQGQESAYTTIDKAASRKGSLLSEISSLSIAYSESEEVKKKEQETQKERWDKAIETLGSIKDAISDSGIVDYTKISAERLLEISKQGGFRVEDKKITSYGDDYLKLGANEKLALKNELRTNYKDLYNEMEKITAFNTSASFAGLQKSLSAWGSGDDEKWFKDFSKVVEAFNTLIDNSALDSVGKADWHSLVDFMSLTLSTTNTEGMNTDFLNKSGHDIAPLWKRIESAALGIPVGLLSGTKSNIETYQDFYSSRNLSTKVFSAIGDVGTQQRLLKYKGYGIKDGDAVYQIDWKKTADAVKEFTLNVSGSSQAIKAYKSALEEERDTLMSLATSGIYTEETEGVSKIGLNKDVNATPLTNLGNLDTQTVVNAFGEKLMTSAGEVIKLTGEEIQDETTKEIRYMAENGKTYSAEELFVTGNIYDALIEALQKNAEATEEATIALLKQDAIDSATKKAFGTKLAFSNYEPFLTTTEKGADRKYVQDVLKQDPDYITNYVLTRIQGAIGSGEKFDTHDGNGGKIALEGTTQTVINDFMANDASEVAWVVRGLYAEAYKAAIETGKNDALQHSKEYNENSGYDYLEGLRENASLTSYVNIAGGKRGSGDLFTSAWGGNSIQKHLLGGIGADPGIADINEFTDGKFKDNENKQLVWAEGFTKAIEQARDGLYDIADLVAKDAFLAPFEELGKSLIDASDFSEGLKESLAGIGKTMLRQLGPVITNCGLQIAASAAASGNWGMVFAGLGLAALGGFTSGISSALDAKEENDNKADKEADKAQDIKDQLAALLEQARKDALYYEMNLRHKKALGTNKEFSLKSVNDAIISPRGDVITTHPDDYLIATKTPEMLGGKAPQTNISFKVINNVSDVKVRQEQRTNELGETELVAIIESVVTDYIASPKGDDAFASRNARTSGRTAVM